MLKMILLSRGRSYGLTFNWKSPFGPVRFDLARPLAEEV